MTADRQPVRLLYQFVPIPSAMLTDWRLNRCALAIWGYLYECGYRNIPPDDDLMLMIVGLPPYQSSGTEEEWKPASRRHLERMLHQLEKAGYLIWQRGEPIHERFTVVLPQAHGHAQPAHGHAQPAHGHAQPAHGHAHYPSIDHENQDHDDDEASAQNLKYSDQGAELLGLGFSKKVALEFQELPAHQFEKITARAREVGREHNGATVVWARAQIEAGWPEPERSNNHAENQPGRRAKTKRRGEPQIDLDDLPEWLRNGWPEGETNHAEDRPGRRAKTERRGEPRQDYEDIPEEWR